MLSSGEVWCPCCDRPLETADLDPPGAVCLTEGPALRVIQGGRSGRVPPRSDHWEGEFK